MELLKNVTDRKFDNKVEWGIDLASEHERYTHQNLIAYSFKGLWFTFFKSRFLCFVWNFNSYLAMLKVFD